MKKILSIIGLLAVLITPFNINASTQKATVFHPDTGSRKVVEVGDPNAFDGGYLLEVVRAVTIRDDELGFSVVTNYSKNLSSSISATQSTIPVTSMDTKDGHTLTMGDIGSKGFLVIEPGSRKEEIVMFTGISGTNFTGVTRGLAFYGTSTASVSANQKTHSSGSTVIISNTHHIFEELVDKDSAETIAGVKTFTDSPIVPSPSANNEVANKAYVDSVAQQGGATSTESVVGISQLATQLEMASSTHDSNNPAVLYSKYSTSSPQVAGNYVVVSEEDGNINQSWLDLTEDFTLTGYTTLASSTLGGTSIIANIITDSITPLNATTTIYGGLSVGGLLDASLALEVIASENLKYSRDTEEDTSEASYTEVAQIVVYFGGTYTVKFDLKGNLNGLGYGRIYKNDVAFGTEQSQGNTAFATKSEDLVFAPGDRISLYIKGDGDSTATIQNFRLYFDMTANLTYGNTEL